MPGLSVEERPEGTWIVLRPRGRGRFVVVGFLLAWLAGWAVGETVAAGALFAFTAQALGIETPFASKAPTSDVPVAFVIPFLAVWLTFWTIGGIAAAGEALYLLFGREEILVGESSFSVRKVRGFLSGALRVYRRGEVREILLRRAGTISVRVAGTDRVHDLASTGSVPFGLWLRDRLALSMGLDVETGPEKRLLEVPAGLPPTMLETIGPRGETLLWDNPRGQRQLTGCAGIVFGGALLAAMGTRVLLGKAATPAIVVAFLFGAFSLFLATAREAVRADRGVLELRKSLPGWSRTRVFREATLTLEDEEDSDGDLVTSLFVETPSARGTVKSTSQHREDVLRLAKELERRTGFPLVVRLGGV